MPTYLGSYRYNFTKVLLQKSPEQPLDTWNTWAYLDAHLAQLEVHR